MLDGVRPSADAAFPEVRGLRGPLTCLSEARRHGRRGQPRGPRCPADQPARDAGELHQHHVSLGKLANVRAPPDVTRRACTLLGANGISLEYPVMRHMGNLESVLTYEGTERMHALAIGQSVTGIPAFG